MAGFVTTASDVSASSRLRKAVNAPAQELFAVLLFKLTAFDLNETIPKRGKHHDVRLS